MKKQGTYLILVIIATICSLMFTVMNVNARNGRGPHDRPVIFVTGQGLYYDSIVTAPVLPQHGPFQELIPTDDGLETEFGPGDPDYRGGRWWIDTNGDGMQDEGDTYFSCPLLPPGFEE
jgi:hypothetical protein